MASLSCAAPPPAPGEVTLYESQCTWVTCPEEEADDEQLEAYLQGNPVLLSYRYGTVSLGKVTLPDVLVELEQAPLFEHSAEAVFLPTTDVNIAKKSFNAWYYSGVMAALETMAEYKVDGVSPWLSKGSLLLLGTLRSISALHSSFYPHLLLSGEELLDKFSSGAHWATSPVRAMQWHPHAPRLAVARKDNIVQVYQVEMTATSSISAFQSGRMQHLKHTEQKRISSVAWRPYSGSTLAVGCQTGVLLWQVRCHPGAPRPQPLHLSASGHTPVTSVAWSSDGKLLASASPADSSFMVWDVTHAECAGTPVCRHGGGGVSLLSWSPAVPGTGMSLLLTGTPSSMFRVWETASFQCERWSNLSGRVVAACWSPKSDMLLFALEGDPCLYYLTFFANTLDGGRRVGGADAAVKCMDLSPIELPSSKDSDMLVQVGGNVQSMAWDHTGERLAVTFTADSPGHGLVAMFNTQTKPVMEVVPSGFIRGRSDETPAVISFRNDLASGSLLSVAWSSGRISSLPLVYSSPLQGSVEVPARAALPTGEAGNADATFNASSALLSPMMPRIAASLQTPRLRAMPVMGGVE